MHESYGQIMAVVKAVVEPIVRDKYSIHFLSDDNLLPLIVPDYENEGYVKIPDEDFNIYWKEVEDIALLCTSERKTILKNYHGLLL